MTEILELDSKRVLRAQDYVAVPLAKGQYRVMTTGVEGQRDSYYYYVQIEPQLICYCSDATYRNAVCKHVIAALYEAGDPRLGTSRSVLSRAHAARGRLPYSIREVPDEPYPDALSLEEALARHASDEGIAQSRRLSGRIITDPGADLEALRQVAHRCSRQSIRAALLRIPVAAADKEIRSALMGEGTTALIIGRLLPTADNEEFRMLFRRLIELDEMKMAREIVEEYENRATQALEPIDLAAFLKSSDPNEREFGMMLLGRLGGSGQRHKAMQPTSQRKRAR